MSDVTRVLSAIEQGDPSAAEQLLPLVYDELQVGGQQHVQRPGQTLDATALVHEAYIRLVDPDRGRALGKPTAFFLCSRPGDAADSRGECPPKTQSQTRRIARKKRHRGLRPRGGEPDEDLSALDEAIDKLAGTDREAAELIALRYFAGLTSSKRPKSSAYRRGQPIAWATAEPGCAGVGGFVAVGRCGCFASMGGNRPRVELLLTSWRILVLDFA